MGITIMVALVSGLAGVLGALVGGVTSLLVHRMEREKEDTSFRRGALDRFRRDRLKAYSELAAKAVYTWGLEGPKEPAIAIQEFGHALWPIIYLLEWDDHLRIREHLRRVNVSFGGEDREELEDLLTELRAFTGSMAAYQSAIYERELRNQPLPSREEVITELEEKTRKLRKAKSALFSDEL